MFAHNLKVMWYGPVIIKPFNRAMSTADRTKTSQIGNTRTSVGRGQGSYSPAVINQTEVFWLLYKKTTLMGKAPLQL